MAHPTTPPWLLLSSSHSHTLIFPQTSLFVPTLSPPTHLHSRVHIIFHALPTRNNNANEDRGGPMLMFPRLTRTRTRTRRRRTRGREQRWWSDDVRHVEGGILQQLVHELWIFKVFRSYGVFLPVILISLLLATGPKAFLMGSGVPFGLSLLAFAFNKLSERVDFSPNPEPIQRPKKAGFGRKGVVSMEDIERQAKRSKGRSYQSRVNRFGGWDELVTEDETDRTETHVSTKARFETLTGRRVESSIEEKELPLLPRLLVGLLPFLGDLL
ncbi:hypothetical protein vseg_012244 [Gypsophila vaccaria]